MSELFNIMKITIGAQKLTARVLVNPGMPLRTSEDIEATARAYYLAPSIADHACLGDTGEHFKDCMADTELAHLLEHMSVEVMRQTGLVDDVVAGRTRAVPADERLFDIELSCPDDVLAIGSLSSAAFMLQWAFANGEAPAPDFEGTVKALKGLVLSLRGESSDAEKAEEAEPGEPDNKESASSIGAAALDEAVERADDEPASEDTATGVEDRIAAGEADESDGEARHEA
ncbi:hypothetical protein [Collinsella ureilytica]|uniref:hypothetical protein n=1 Tax=Collinsella ureilytica TaxID=2869515 RepID=UPI0027D34D73|nr:hypothetical protein [Collinsella urealyticum]